MRLCTCDIANCVREADGFGDRLWRCPCGHCHSMETELESCCKEVERVWPLIPEEAGCVTAHPIFSQACLNVHTLEVAYYALRNDHPDFLKAPEIHKYVVKAFSMSLF
ncbi:hypothetical protein MRX96_048250 [Rhipicephalus microplus]